MKQLITLLMASWGMASFAQVAVSPPALRLYGGEDEAASAKAPVLQEGNPVVSSDKGPKRTWVMRPSNVLSQKEMTKSALAAEGKPTIKLTGMKRVASDKARIVLNVESDWGLGDGFEIWLDKDCTIENDFCSNGVGYEEVFANTDIVIPEGATPDKGFLVGGESASMDIEPGVYDFLVVNASPADDEKVFLVLATSDSHGDDVTFVAGFEYTFTVSVEVSPYEHDMAVLTTDSSIDLGIVASDSPANGSLTDAEAVSMTIRNIGTLPCEHFIASYTVDDGTTVTEAVDETIPAGGSLTYTFEKKADLSAEGVHKIALFVQGVGEALVMEENRYVSYVSCSNTALQPPYFCDFSDDADVAEWNFINADNDSYTWKIEPGRAYSWFCYDDYMVMATPVALPAGTNTIELSYRSLLNDPNDRFEVLYGTSPDVESMTVLKTYEGYATVAQMSDGFEFDVAEAGDYYFAFHACPPANADLPCTDILNVKIYSGSSQGTPDLKVDKVIVPNSSCGIDDFDIQVEVSNIGTAPVKSFNLTASYAGNEFSSQNFEVPVAVNGKASVTFEMPDDFVLTPGTLYYISITASAVISDNDVEEENTENNTGGGSFVDFEEAEVPFKADFTNSEAGRYYWYGPEGWIYNSVTSSYEALFAGVPLLSRGVNLKAGKTYRMTYNRRAGMNYYGYIFYDSYKILCGPNGEDPSTWTEISHPTRDYSNGGFVETSFDFTVPSDGLYQFAFSLDYINQTYTFYLRDVMISEVVEKDVSISSVNYMPTRVPQSQAGEFEAQVPVTNEGSATVSGTVTMTANGELIGQGEFTDLAPRETRNIPVYVTIDGAIGTEHVTVTANVEGEAEENLYNNTETVDVLITEHEMAYDNIADGTYYGNQPNNVDVSTIGSGGELEAGIFFHLNNDAKLDGISVGWGESTEMSGVKLNVYKWTPTEPDANGYYPLRDDALVYTTTVDKELTIGQIEYAIKDTVVLEAGDYLITAHISGRYPLAVDRKFPGQVYIVGEYGEGPGLVVVDYSSTDYGTLAIRALLTDPEAASIGSVGNNGTTLSLYPNPATTTLTITAGEEEITNVTIYSVSGAIMCASGVSGNSFTCNVSGYAPGVYLAKVTTQTGTEVIKFMVK